MIRDLLHALVTQVITHTRDFFMALSQYIILLLEKEIRSQHKDVNKSKACY